MTASALRACAEVLNTVCSGLTCPVRWNITPARCGVARCNKTPLGAEDTGSVYAGMIPVRMCPQLPTAALTELAGGPADPRQVYHTAFDNPSMVLHIIGNDLTALDALAERVLTLDRSAHIDTPYGKINGLRVSPPRREVRKDRPRYDVQLTIDMEMIR